MRNREKKICDCEGRVLREVMSLANHPLVDKHDCRMHAHSQRDEGQTVECNLHSTPRRHGHRFCVDLARRQWHH